MKVFVDRSSGEERAHPKFSVELDDDTFDACISKIQRQLGATDIPDSVIRLARTVTDAFAIALLRTIAEITEQSVQRGGAIAGEMETSAAYGSIQNFIPDIRVERDRPFFISRSGEAASGSEYAVNREGRKLVFEWIAEDDGIPGSYRPPNPFGVAKSSVAGPRALDGFFTAGATTTSVNKAGALESGSIFYNQGIADGFNIIGANSEMAYSAQEAYDKAIKGILLQARIYNYPGSNVRVTFPNLIKELLKQSLEEKVKKQLKEAEKDTRSKKTKSKEISAAKGEDSSKIKKVRASINKIFPANSRLASLMNINVARALAALFTGNDKTKTVGSFTVQLSSKAKSYMITELIEAEQIFLSRLETEKEKAI